MIKLALGILLLVQTQGGPQTPFGFGAAKAHAHPAGAAFNVTGVYCGNQLFDDPANTTGNYFYGNSICVDSGAGKLWYWFDWPADPNGSTKLATWRSMTTVITLRVADPDCLLALSAVEGAPTLLSNVSGGGVYRGTATLTATLTSAGAALGGKSISFTLNGAAAGTAVTDANGVATVTNVGLSGINAGTYGGAVVATFAGDKANMNSGGTGDLVVGRAEQTIAFAPLVDKTFGDPDVALSATAASGLSVNFSGAGNCTVASSAAHITGAGSCTVTASQAGDSNYNAAPAVQRSFQVAKASQTITFAPLVDKTFGDAPFALSASSSAGLPVSFSVVSGAATLGGDTLTLTGAGAVTVRASQAGNSNYNAAAPVERSFNVAKAGQTITFGVLSDRTYGDPDFQVGATASSVLAVSFAAAGNCSANGSSVHVTGAGSCTVTASQAGNTNYSAAAGVSRSFQIAKAASSVALSSSGTPVSSGQSVTFTAAVTSAAGTPAGSVQFKVDGASLGSPQTLSAGGVASISTGGLSTGAHVVTAEYAGDANFNASAGTLAGGQFIGGLFEFAQPLFTVNERDGSVSVTVRRRGDTSQAAAVEYTTDDGSISSVTVPCSSTTGIALERCDYTHSQGLLQFAPGETQKTFSVLVNDDSYLEGTETTHLRLSNPSAGTALGEAASAALEIADDTQQASNPLAASAFFVRQHYHDFLNREPDASGLAFWTDEIERCGADAACREVKRINVSAAFFLSIEFQQTGYLAYLSHKAAFGNLQGKAVPVTLAEMLQDMQVLGAGIVVGADGWKQKLEQNKQAYFDQLSSSARFAALYPQSMTAEAYVNALNANAGGALSAGERDALVAGLKNSTTTRAQALRAVAEDSDLNAAEKNKAFVLMQYFGYLRRNPDDAPDSDFGGWSFWLGKLNEFNGNYINAEMVKAFISSIEYRQRFGQ